ncbi:MAG: PpiC-type peptidyl-prolyl cis-trans isomerase [uncultured bacterium]|nr:MAG: PpiC-type peptidyl-prolyl cis-trans isomerase [uncultured bacterium]
MAKAMRFLAGAALCVALAAPAMAQDATADTVIATVNGTNITLGNVIMAREALPEQYKALPPDVLFKGIVDQLVQQTVLAQSMGETLSKKDTLQLENDRRGYLSNTALQPVVAAAVSDEALQKAYDDRFKGAAPATEYNAAHILVADEAKANELKAQLDGGADFAELAKANSTDTGSGANGGDLGWFGLGAMVKPFEDAVVAAEVGKVSGPIKSDFGFHLILVKETRIAAKPTLDDMRDELAVEIEQKTVEAHIKALTDAAKIEKPGEGIDPALISDLTLLDK